MIFVSTSCLKSELISESIEILAGHGIHNIELSGGTGYYPSIKNDLVHLKERYGLNYIIHNYFPPPEKDFVINLASFDETIYKKSLLHAADAIALAGEIGAQKIGFHAGFLIDLKPEELGDSVKFGNAALLKEASDRFIASVKHLSEMSRGVKLYFENNVISKKNYITFNKKNPFMLTCADDYYELVNRVDFNLLLDIAHLYVSSSTLGFNFSHELEKLIDKTDYIHLSENDGESDNNQPLSLNSPVLNTLRNYDLSEKTITLEIYSSIGVILKSIENLKSLTNIRNIV